MPKKARKGEVKPRPDLKPVSVITPAIAEKIEGYFNKNAAKLLERLGLEMKVAAVGGRYNRDRLVLEIGLLPHKATEVEINDFIEDQASYANERESEDVLEDPVAELAAKLGLTEKRILSLRNNWNLNAKKLHKRLGSDLDLGSRIVTPKGIYEIFGFNPKTKAVCLYNIDSNIPTGMPVKKVADMERVEDGA